MTAAVLAVMDRHVVPRRIGRRYDRAARTGRDGKDNDVHFICIALVAAFAGIAGMFTGGFPRALVRARVRGTRRRP